MDCRPVRECVRARSLTSSPEEGEHQSADQREQADGQQSARLEADCGGHAAQHRILE
jgi:hypothetical protein